MSFSLDTSSLIWAWRFAYPRANFPTLWQRFEALIRDGEMRASSLRNTKILEGLILHLASKPEQSLYDGVMWLTVSDTNGPKKHAAFPQWWRSLKRSQWHGNE